MNIAGNQLSTRYVSYGLIAAVALWGSLKSVAEDHETHAAKGDAAFIKEAAKSGHMEVEMGKLAASQGQNSQIKELGQRLQRDHSKANQELMQIAKNQGLMLPTDAQDHKTASPLEGKTGAEFDKAFAQHAIMHHQKDIRQFQTALNDTKDPELKGFIQKTLPVLREHLVMARNAARAVGVDRTTLESVDRFLQANKGQGSHVGREGLGTAAGSETGAGQNALPDSKISDTSDDNRK